MKRRIVSAISHDYLRPLGSIDDVTSALENAGGEFGSEIKQLTSKFFLESEQLEGVVEEFVNNEKQLRKLSALEAVRLFEREVQAPLARLRIHALDLRSAASANGFASEGNTIYSSYLQLRKTISSLYSLAGTEPISEEEDKKFRVRIEDTNPVNLLKKASSTIFSDGFRKGTVDFELDDQRTSESKSTPLSLDQGILYSVIFNILENSRKYRNKEKNTLKVVSRVRGYFEKTTTANQLHRPSLPVRAGGKFCVISICDNGVGISKDDINKVMQPGYRGKSALGVEGTGMGLAISQSYLESIGGTLVVDSDGKHGTIVHIVVPAKQK